MEEAAVKSYEQINERIAAGKAVVLTAEEVSDYVEKKGLENAVSEIDVVTTATFGPMCSSGCFLNFGHTTPKIRMTEAWIDDVSAYAGIAAVDLYLGATQIQRGDPANLYFPGEFRYGGGHVIERLVAGRELELLARSYATDDYPAREVRGKFSIRDLNQAVMVNPRNCYQNYNVAINCSEKTIYTYLGVLKPKMRNLAYCSAGQLSPLLNDPFYETIGIGTSIWLAGARGHVYAEGTQHGSLAERDANGVPMEGAGTLALTADMKKMRAEYVRGVSLKGYGVSLALGVGVPIPIINSQVLRRTTVRDREITAPVIDYSYDYPEKTGRIITRLSYEEMKSGKAMVEGNSVETCSVSSYAKAREIAEILKSEIVSGDFLLSKPTDSLPREKKVSPLKVTPDVRR